MSTVSVLTKINQSNILNKAFSTLFSSRRFSNNKVYKNIPKNIVKPDYSVLSLYNFKGYQYIENASELKKLTEACKIAKHVLQSARDAIKPGITTNEINSIVHDKTIKLGAFPSPLGYRGFPKSCCTSVNHVCCHGIPDNTKLRDGDIINVDVSVYHHGYHGDTSDTFPVGKVDPTAELLIATARECLQAAILRCGNGQLLSEIGSCVQGLAEKRGFTVSEKFVGHGIGRHFHCLPQVKHYRNQSEERMYEGMVFTIEPIVMEGSNGSRTLDDGWTEISVDGLRSSQAEHTLVVTRDSCKVLT